MIITRANDPAKMSKFFKELSDKLALHENELVQNPPQVRAQNLLPINRTPLYQHYHDQYRTQNTLVFQSTDRKVVKDDNNNGEQKYFSDFDRIKPCRHLIKLHNSGHPAHRLQFVQDSLFSPNPAAVRYLGRDNLSCRLCLRRQEQLNNSNILEGFVEVPGQLITFETSEYAKTRKRTFSPEPHQLNNNSDNNHLRPESRIDGRISRMAMIHPYETATSNDNQANRRMKNITRIQTSECSTLHPTEDIIIVKDSGLVCPPNSPQLRYDRSGRTPPHNTPTRGDVTHEEVLDVAEVMRRLTIRRSLDFNENND